MHCIGVKIRCLVQRNAGRFTCVSASKLKFYSNFDPSTSHDASKVSCDVAKVACISIYIQHYGRHD